MNTDERLEAVRKVISIIENQHNWDQRVYNMIPKQYMIAQFLWETNEGRSRLFQEQNNCFGIRCRQNDTIQLKPVMGKNPTSGSYVFLQGKTLRHLKQFQTGCNKDYAVYEDYNESVYDLILWLKTTHLTCRLNCFRDIKASKLHQKSYQDFGWNKVNNFCKHFDSTMEYAKFLKTYGYFEDDTTRYAAGLEIMLIKYREGKYE